MASVKGLTDRLLGMVGREQSGSGMMEGEGKDSPIYKALIPNFLYKPPYGYPRYIDISEIRRLARTPFVEMCVSTIVNELSAVEWQIAPKDKESYNEEHIKIGTDFFRNPNVNKESFDCIRRRFFRDLTQIDSGVMEKVFDNAGYLAEIFARDSATFTKSPDIHGTFNGRESRIPVSYKEMFSNVNLAPNDPSILGVAKKAAYFQYGWNQPARPIPFGTDEIIYMMVNPQPDSIYGRGAMETLTDVVQALKFGVDYFLDTYTDNNIPKGVMSAIGMNQSEIDAFMTKWKEKLRTRNEVGKWRKRFHYMPMVGNEVKFEKLQFSAEDLQVMQQQQWFIKLVWACFGLTPSELGYTETSNRATEIVQSRIFRRKALRPILNAFEYHINNEIIPHFNTGIKVRRNGKEERYTGIDDIRFEFKMTDKEEERESLDMYQIKLKNGILTPNEVREELGYEPIDGGDKLRTAPVSPFASRSQNDAEENIERLREGKALMGKPPLATGEFEVITTASKLKEKMKEKLKEMEKEVIQFIDYHEMPFKKKTAKDMKALKEYTEFVEEMIKPDKLREIITQAIMGAFNKSIQGNELKLDMNIIPSKDTVDFLQKNAFENIKGMTEELGNKLSQTLRMAVIEGWDTRKIKSKVKEIFDSTENRAETIARTEMSRAENSALNDTIKSSGLEGKVKWETVLDDKTSEICKHLHGQEVKTGKKFKYKDWEGFHPPAHPNCRSTITFIPE